MSVVEQLLVLAFRRWTIILLHASLVGVGYWLAFVLRFEFPLAPEDWRQFLKTLPLILLLRLVAFARFHVYEDLWRYVSMQHILTILKAVSLSTVLFALAVLGLFDPNFPWPIFPIDWGTCLLLVGGGRLALRANREWRMRSRGGERRALIIGAGDAGELLIREIGRNPNLHYHIAGFADDDTKKQGRRIHGVEVLGTIDELSALCWKHEVQELLIAIPSATGAEIRRIIGACRAATVAFKTMPSLVEMTESAFTVSKVRHVRIDDLLRRAPIRIDDAGVKQFILGKRVLVTGAGGSIGSELCRQLVTFQPENLVLLDRAENNLFFVEMELRQRFAQVDLRPVIGDVTDESRMMAIFQAHKPQIVFHAAAHKHVPLMEANRSEAVKNNVRGTVVVANAAWRTGVEDFVMISTDKAVRPSSIMGATKRLAEMYVQALNLRIETRFMTVRFGNVLGSEGSVLQVFQKQIECGGPVTVTHPEMKRYFMTIPEASQLVLQAATLGEGGEIFVLDMGEPVRIVDLAKDLISLSGMDPEKDIEIKFTGPRPGEKLYEELLSSETRVLATSHEKIMVVETEPVAFEELAAEIDTLLASAEMNDAAALLKKLCALVPEYADGIVPASHRHKDVERILLVDNDSYTRTALKHILRSCYEIVEADNQRDALKFVKETRPSLVIVNFHLPWVNIGRMCARIREEAGEHGHMNRALPIILVVDSAATIGKPEIVSLGADDRIYKPLPVDIVEKRVRELLERGSAHKAGPRVVSAS